MRPTVYLAGPITGLNFQGAVDWRNQAREELAAAGIDGLSPMRGKEYLEEIARDVAFTSDGDKYAIQGPLSTNRGITTRDRWDTQRCDLVLMNLLPAAGRISIGTMIELGWADSVRTPVVCVMEPGNVHEHGMVFETIGYRVHTLEQGLSLVKAILKPGTVGSNIVPRLANDTRQMALPV